MPEMMYAASAEIPSTAVHLTGDFQEMIALLSGVYVGMPYICNALRSGCSRAKHKNRSVHFVEDRGSSKMQQWPHHRMCRAPILDSYHRCHSLPNEKYGTTIPGAALLTFF